MKPNPIDHSDLPKADIILLKGCSLSLMGIFIIGFSCLFWAGTVSPLLNGQSLITPTEAIATAMATAVAVVAMLLIMASIFVGIKPRREKASLSSAPGVKSLRLIDAAKPTESDTSKTKKHWTGVKRLASDDFGWGLFLGAAGVSLFATILPVAFACMLAHCQSNCEFIKALSACLALAIMPIGCWHFTVTTFMHLRNPILNIGLAENPIPIGGKAALVWEVDGDSSRIKNLKFELHGTQSTFVYVPPGDSSYCEELFEIIPIHETFKPKEIKAGSVMLSIPESTIHSLKSGSDQVIWTIKVTGEIPRWVDLEVSYLIAIVPPVLPKANQKPRTNVQTKNQPMPPVKNGALS